MRVLVTGGVTFNSLISLESLPEPAPATIFSKDFYETTGGTGAGKALNLNRLGLDVTLHALLGDDPQGDLIRARFADEKLDFQTDNDPLGTERHVNLMDSDGRRVSIYVNYATFEPNIDLGRLAPLVAGCDLLALNIINYCRYLIPIAREHGKPIWCDIHNYDGESDYHQDFIDAADVLFLSSDSLPDYLTFMQRMIQAGKQMVICTHGKDGSTVITAANDYIETNALTSYPQVDTNGAGDSFFAGFLYGYSQGYTVARCAQLGTVNAALCVGSRELYATDLTREKLEAEWRKHYNRVV